MKFCAECNLNEIKKERTYCCMLCTNRAMSKRHSQKCKSSHDEFVIIECIICNQKRNVAVFETQNELLNK
jgi:hypothetical protein